MAVTNISKAKLQKNTASEVVLTSIASTTDGALCGFDGHSERMLLLLQNNGEAQGTVTVKAGDTFSSLTDKVVTIDAGDIVALVVDSVKYKITKGENRGNVKLIPSTTDFKASVLEL